MKVTLTNKDSSVTARVFISDVNPKAVEQKLHAMAIINAVKDGLSPNTADFSVTPAQAMGDTRVAIPITVKTDGVEDGQQVELDLQKVVHSLARWSGFDLRRFAASVTTTTILP